MKKYIILLLILLSSKISFTQSKYSLIGEGKDINISLLWSVTEWEEIDGVVIKRRLINSKNGSYSNWETLTKELLEQYNQQSKSLNNTCNSNTKINQLSEKRTELLNNNTGNGTTLTEINISALSQELQQNEVLKMLGLMFSFDYDIALMYGFGYMDFELPKYHKVEYGLFTVKSGVESSKEVASFSWIYNSKPDIEIEPIKTKIKKRGEKIQLELLYNGKEMDSKTNLVGFNIYRSINNSFPIKINEKVIWLNKSSNKRLLYYEDVISDSEAEYNYQIAPVSVFKNEGKAYAMSWSKLSEIAITAPVLISKQNKNVNYLEEGAELIWTFDENLNEHIQGFIIQRALGEDIKFVNITDTLTSVTRKFIDDKLPKDGTQKIQYRVIALQEESHSIWSNVLRLYNNPKPLVSNSIPLNAKSEINGNLVKVNLNWEASQKMLDGINRFVLYCDRSGGVLAKEISSLQKELNYTYNVEGVSGKKYLFAVKCEYMDGEVANYTDTVEVIVPSERIPFISVWPFRVSGSNLSFDWKYPTDIADLAGFRIYLNDELFKDEKNIGSKLRSFTIENLKPGDYKLEMEAVTTFGVKSKKSRKLNITIE